MEYVNMFIEGIVNSIEEFFDAMTMPSSKYVSDAFKVSLIFVGASVAAKFLNFWCFVQWQEATVCSVMLFIVMMFDVSTRQSIKGSVGKIREIAKQHTYNETDEEEVIEDEPGTEE